MSESQVQKIVESAANCRATIFLDLDTACQVADVILSPIENLFDRAKVLDAAAKERPEIKRISEEHARRAMEQRKR